jgi:hypothetical protein
VDIAQTAIAIATVALAGSLFTILRQYLRSLISAVADLLRRWRNRRNRLSIKVRSGDLNIVVSGVSAERAEEIVKDFLSRYPPAEGEGAEE